MSKINQTPIGLQSLLGNVNQGVNPSELDGNVSPGVDLLPFWGYEKTKFRVVGGSVAHTVGQGTEMVVPTGEVWLPIAVSADSFNLTTQEGILALHITDNLGATRTVIAQSAFQADSGNTQRVACGVIFSTRFLMGAGMRFRAEWNSAIGPATNSTMNIDLTYYSIRD